MSWVTTTPADTRLTARLTEAIEAAMRAGLTDADLCRLTDDALIFHLPERFASNEAVVALVEGFSRRRLFSRTLLKGRSAIQQAARTA